MGFDIIGTGSFLPERAVTNNELSLFLDTDDEWISTRTGIRERRICTAEDVSLLAEKAAENAIADAGIKPDDIDFIIVSTTRGDKIFPSLACILQKRLGASCAGIDLNAACAGFIYAMDTANAFFEAKGYRHILVVAAEVMTRIVDWNDRSVCVLFGDGAGAAVLKKSDNIFESRLTITGDENILYADNSMGNCPYTEKRDIEIYTRMNGREVYKFAVSSIEDDVGYLCRKREITPEDVDVYILHQANRRIIDAARARLSLSEDRFPVNIDRYGNTSSASVPILLDELSRGGRLKTGQRIIMSAFGAGLTTASCLMNWTKAK